MNILVTNDDGITASALYALREQLSDLGRVFIVAPDRDQSATSHSLTLYRPMRIEQPEKDVYAIDGTPTDCVLISNNGLLPEAPDLVVSGVNRGPNMGDDVFYSGTVAAAIEGALQGLPALAVSLVASGLADFTYSAELTRRLVGEVLARGLPPKTILNVNVPSRPRAEIAGVKITRLGKRVYQDTLIERLDPRGRKYYWIGGDAPIWEPEPGSDFLAVDQGYVSVTPLHLNLTDDPLRAGLEEWQLSP
ncbi:MAG: 5'/3'-nucleotidase SurE [Candidatus Eiseniibacteriota bacterium]